MAKDKGFKLLSLFLLALVLFNFPIIKLFSSYRLLAGMPPLYLYIFSAWLLLIILTIRIVEKPKADKRR